MKDSYKFMASGSDRIYEGPISFYLNGHNTMHVYIGPLLAATYSDCTDEEEAWEMFQEDFEEVE